jgi:hypothetical protein
MQLRPVVKFRGVPSDVGLENDIRRRVARLRTYHPGIIGCRVLVAQPGRHRRTGRTYNVRIDVSLPHGRVEISHAASLRAEARAREQASYRKQDVSARDRRHAVVAVRRAFEDARRRLQDFTRRQRGDVKAHTEAART